MCERQTIWCDIQSHIVVDQQYFGWEGCGDGEGKGREIKKS